MGISYLKSFCWGREGGTWLKPRYIYVIRCSVSVLITKLTGIWVFAHLVSKRQDWYRWIGLNILTTIR